MTEKSVNRLNSQYDRPDINETDETVATGVRIYRAAPGGDI